MTAASSIVHASRPPRRQTAILWFTVVMAALGSFPYHLLYLCPLAASLTLPLPNRVLKRFVAAVALVMLVLGLVSGL